MPAPHDRPVDWHGPHDPAKEKVVLTIEQFSDLKVAGQVAGHQIDALHRERAELRKALIARGCIVRFEKTQVVVMDCP